MDDLDHRNLGVKLKLWHLQEDAPGMVFWHPRGYAVYRVLEDYVRRKMRRAGYAEVRTPQLLPQEFWGRSGHWDKFSEHMFRVDDGELAMALKPMSCPCHVQIFNKGLRSWRELPIRYAEFGACHRNVPSGSLHGIMRTRDAVTPMPGLAVPFTVFTLVYLFLSVMLVFLLKRQFLHTAPNRGTSSQAP